MARRRVRERPVKSDVDPELDGWAIADPDAPAEMSDAGTDADLTAAYILQRIREFGRPAKRTFVRAQRLVQRDRNTAERLARGAIAMAARSYWWSEDTEWEARQHALVHKIGKWTRKSFGCHLAFTGTEYRQNCPASLMHNRFGVSAGMVGDAVCSLCGQDLSICPHIRGRSYWVAGGPSSVSEICRVCNDAGCKHRADRLYRAGVVASYRNMEFRELSIVRRPATPEARFSDTPVSTSELAEKFGDRFRLGAPISCDLCLGPCPGFVELPEGYGDGHAPMESHT
jgi:hypothetical protein